MVGSGKIRKLERRVDELERDMRKLGEYFNDLWSMAFKLAASTGHTIKHQPSVGAHYTVEKKEIK